MKKIILSLLVFGCLVFTANAQNIQETGSRCENTLALLLNEDVENIQWSKDGDVLKNENNKSLNVAKYGSGEYIASFFLDGESIVSSKIIEPYGPSPSFTFVKYEAIGGSQFYGEVNVDDTTIESWAWDIGIDVISTEQNPVIVFPGEGAYQVTLTVTDHSGCQSEYSITIDWFYGK